MEFFIQTFFMSILLMAVVLPSSWALLTWVTPKSVIEQYVRPPHFSEFESVAYRYYPTSLIRTLLFSMTISVPFFRRVRKFGDMQKNVPLWFNIACRFFVYGVLGYSFSLIAIMLTLVLMIKLDIAPSI